ncbi:MAG: alpha-L-fucosidase [Eubacteriales bacterium]|nr:alpha-L-fucosidase [Eubacteriales bacterium]
MSNVQIINKFGMFIHWGIYSVKGYHEQYRGRMGISRSEYRNLMYEFDPVKYNPDEWVDLAHNAGMEYICFTAKHHDGFCMWDTKYTDFNIMNTPYGRDVLKMLAEACERRGMLLSIYYSVPDWNHPNAYNPASSHQAAPEPSDKPDTALYREYVKNQITELLTGYGKIYTLFWDIPPRIKDPSINELVRRLQPDILINNRGYDEGDFETPERKVPEGDRFDKLTEACQSVGQESWGYRSNEDYYTSGFLMKSIDKIMAMGGSYLLNAGPMPDGRIDDHTAAVIRRVGSWYTRVREALQGAAPPAGPVADWPQKSKYIVVEKGGYVYLHFYEGLNASGATLKPVTVLPLSAVLLNDMSPIRFSVETMPSVWDGSTLKTREAYLHLFGIPAERFCDEPLVVRLKFRGDYM